MSSFAVAASAPNLLSPDVVVQAAARIAPFIHRTPLAQSSLLNGWLGHDIIFKMENTQKSGSFKIRGALNALLSLKEQGQLPQWIVAFSSGNHASAVAKVGGMLRIKTTVIMPSFVSKVKQLATAGYGAELMLTGTRQEAEKLAYEYQAKGAYLLHPYDNDMSIAGQGTACYEALEDGAKPDAIFAVCGGGSLLSGTWLAARALASGAKVFGCEPKLANDAARSYKSGTITGFEQSPMTIADGARTLRVADRTFAYLRRLDDFFEVEERDIIYWTQWMQHLLKANVEPTAAVPMAAAYEWLKKQSGRKRLLVMVSGGNVDTATHRQVWERGYLEQLPAL